MNFQKLAAYQPNTAGSESVLSDSNGMLWTLSDYTWDLHKVVEFDVCFLSLWPTMQFPQLPDEKITRGRSFTKQGFWQLCQCEKLSFLICSYRFCSALPPHLVPIKLFVRLNWETHQGLGKIKRKEAVLYPHRYPDSVPARSAQNTCFSTPVKRCRAEAATNRQEQELWKPELLRDKTASLARASQWGAVQEAMKRSFAKFFFFN